MLAPKIAKADTRTAKGPNNKLFPRHAAILTAQAAPSRGAWDFSSIAVFPPPCIVQPKLVVGEVNDPLEHEAERVADQVTRMPNWLAAPVLAAPSRISPIGQDGGEVPGLMHGTRLSSGHPLDPPTRAYFEPRFGHDFSRVRVHTDAQAAASAKAIGARAYTAGSEIVFGGGEFSPSSREGGKLLAHELVHVIRNASAPGAPVIRRLPAGGPTPYEVVSPVWRVSGRDIVAVRIKADGRIFLMYRRTGLGEKFGSAPPPGTWAPFDGIVPQDKLTGKGARTRPYFEKNPYYDKPPMADPHARGEAATMRGYGTRTNEDVAGWLNKQNIAKGKELEWQEVQLELGRYKPVAPLAPPAREISGPKVPPSEASGAAKVEGAVGKAESEIVKGEGAAAKFAGLGAKAGRLADFLIDLALPGPLDVLFLWISFFGSLAEAKAKLREEWFAVGFSEGIAARLLGVPADEATNMLTKGASSRGSVGEQVAGFGRVRERATNEGAVGGWNFAGRLGAKQRAGFLKEGFTAIKGKGHTISSNFNLDDVIELGVAIKPMVDELLEVARAQEEAAREEEEARKYLEFQEATLRYGPKE